MVQGTVYCRRLLIKKHRRGEGVNTLEILEGDLPQRARALVVEWASLHRRELLANWERARQQLPLERIEPLD